MSFLFFFLFVFKLGSSFLQKRGMQLKVYNCSLLEACFQIIQHKRRRRERPAQRREVGQPAIKRSTATLRNLLFFSQPVHDWQLPATPYEIMSRVLTAVKKADLLHF